MKELFQSIKTKEGIPVFNFERKGGPISIIFNIKGGSVEDPIGKEGLAHFVEHMFMSGTKSFPSKDLLALELEKLGAAFSANTSAENIKLEVIIANKTDSRKVLEIVSEIFSDSLFLEKTFRSEKNAIFTEIGLANSNPQRHMNDLYRKAFFGGNLLGRPTLGTPESLNTICIDDLKNYFSKLKTPSRFSVISAGDISVDEIAKTVSRLSLDGNSDFISDKKTSILKDVVEECSVDNVYNVCGYKMKKISLKEYVILRILQYYLSGSRASVLMKKLRYDKGLVYGCSSKPGIYEYFTNFYINTSFKKENRSAVMDIIKKEFEDIKNKGIPQKILDDMVKRLIKNLPIRHESSMDFILSNLIPLTHFDKPYTTDNFVDVLKTITAKNIKDFAQNNFLEEKFASATIVPK